MFRTPTAILLALLLTWPLGLYASTDRYDAIHAYVGGGIHSWNTDDASAQGLKFRVGQQLTTFSGVELQFAMGGEDKDEGVSLERLFGLYGRFTLPLDMFTPYAKIGMTSANMDDDGDSVSEFEISYGLGAEINLTPNFFLDFEYMVYTDTAELSLSGFTLGLGYRLP